MKLKWLLAIVIFCTSLLCGVLSLKFSLRFRKQLEIGGAFANGIFMGVALFHLLPEAAKNLKRLSSHFVHLKVMLLACLGYSFFLAIEKIIILRLVNRSINLGAFVIAFSFHAYIAGLILGLSQSSSILSMLFIAILVHKGFETFAFVVNIYRKAEYRKWLFWILSLFSLITPAGIVMGMSGSSHLFFPIKNTLIGSFSAIAGGTFLYLGSTDLQQLEIKAQQDSHQQYARILSMLLGIATMGLISLCS